MLLLSEACAVVTAWIRICIDSGRPRVMSFGAVVELWAWTEARSSGVDGDEGLRCGYLLPAGLKLPFMPFTNPGFSLLF
ncbi:hypothetical protein CASFOL_001454 [Castilleja foliolosa]|uniref:Uncharacterized protein n=1 Tax=Castilleja foliolosa TaxID=1961234 RepID=A0ABD3EKI4_9LAMI